MNPLNDQQLNEIEQRANAATKGPWGFYDGDNYADVAADLTMTSRASYSYREKIAQLEDENYWDDPAHEDDDEGRASEQMVANAAFIAHARTDVEQLVDEVRRLRARVAELEARHLPKLCECGHTRLVHTVPTPHSCFAGKIKGAEPCDCGEYRQLSFAEAERRIAERHAAQAEQRAAAVETHVVADDSDDPEHIDDCPGCEAFALTGHVAAVRPAVETGA